MGVPLVLEPLVVKFDIRAVERVLADYREKHVIGFEAGHSVYDDPVRKQRLDPLPMSSACCLLQTSRSRCGY